MAASLAAAVLILGCGHKTKSEDTNGIVLVAQYASGPTNLINKIGKTDHIVVAYRFAEQTGQFKDCTLTIKGEEMKKILFAIAALKSDTGTYFLNRAAYDWQMQFYKGNACLGTANFQDDTIRCIECGADYQDGSGVVKELYWRMQEKCR